MQDQTRLAKACQDRGYVSIHNTEFVAANVFVLFLGTWALSLALDTALRTIKKGYERLSIYHQRNCVTYIIEIMYTSIVFLLQLKYGFSLMFYGETNTMEEKKGLSYAAVLLTGLYSFELAYRLQTHWQLAVHHLIAIGVLLVAFYNWFDYPDQALPVIRMCCVFVLHASTEQLCFLALLLHRLLDHHQYTNLLRHIHLFAALSSYVLKTTICIITWILWLPFFLQPQDKYNSYIWFWRWVFPVLNFVMLFVQWWASTIFWSLSRRFQKMMIREEDADVLRYKNQVAFCSDYNKNIVSATTESSRMIYMKQISLFLSLVVYIHTEINTILSSLLISYELCSCSYYYEDAKESSVFYRRCFGS